MGLIACPDCGKDVSDRAPACPHCGAPVAEPKDANQPQKVIVADGTFASGEEAGRGCAMFLTSAPMAFVVFFVAWFFGATLFADRAGFLAEGATPPLWFAFVLFVAPVILAVVGRKVIRRVIPIIMGSALLLVLAIVGFFLLWMGFSMTYSLLFDWPGAH
jgi:hypothetical protein